MSPTQLRALQTVGLSPVPCSAMGAGFSFLTFHALARLGLVKALPLNAVRRGERWTQYETTTHGRVVLAQLHTQEEHDK